VRPRGRKLHQPYQGKPLYSDIQDHARLVRMHHFPIGTFRWVRDNDRRLSPKRGGLFLTFLFRAFQRSEVRRLTFRRDLHAARAALRVPSVSFQSSIRAWMLLHAARKARSFRCGESATSLSSSSPHWAMTVIRRGGWASGICTPDSNLRDCLESISTSGSGQSQELALEAFAPARLR
jgi:hypothetical protein